MNRHEKAIIPPHTDRTNNFIGSLDMQYLQYDFVCKYKHPRYTDSLYLYMEAPSPYDAKRRTSQQLRNLGLKGPRGNKLDVTQFECVEISRL